MLQSPKNTTPLWPLLYVPNYKHKHKHERGLTPKEGREPPPIACHICIFIPTHLPYQNLFCTSTKPTPPTLQTSFLIHSHPLTGSLYLTATTMCTVELKPVYLNKYSPKGPTQHPPLMSYLTNPHYSHTSQAQQ